MLWPLSAFPCFPRHRAKWLVVLAQQDQATRGQWHWAASPTWESKRSPSSSDAKLMCSKCIICQVRNSKTLWIACIVDEPVCDLSLLKAMGNPPSVSESTKPSSLTVKVLVTFHDSWSYIADKILWRSMNLQSFCSGHIILYNFQK